MSSSDFSEAENKLAVNKKRNKGIKRRLWMEQRMLDYSGYVPKQVPQSSRNVDMCASDALWFCVPPPPLAHREEEEAGGGYADEEDQFIAESRFWGDFCI